MPTPQITLKATLLDFSGVAIGSATNPAKLRIALCGYGQALPNVAGVGNIAKVASWPSDILFEGTLISVPLWGNDVISPSGTYYEIAVIDTLGNVVQSGIYQFTGTQTIDLSNAVQITQPSLLPPIITEYSQLLKNSGVAGSTTYTLAYTPAARTIVKAFLNGIKLLAASYSVSGVTMTLNFTPANGDYLEAVYFHS